MYVWTLKTRRLRQNRTNFRYRLDVVSLNEDLDVEKELYGKAVTKRFNHKRIPVYDEIDFIEALKQLYPAAATVVVANMDERDVEGAPHMIAHSLRKISFTSHYSGYTKNTMNYVDSSATWEDLYAVIEDGEATINVITKRV